MRRILHCGAGCLRSILDSLNRQFAKLFQLAAERFHLTAQMRVLKFDDFVQMLCIGELQREIEVRLGVLPGKRRDLFIQLLEVIRSRDRGCVDALEIFSLEATKVSNALRACSMLVFMMLRMESGSSAKFGVFVIGDLSGQVEGENGENRVAILQTVEH
jgi:hypothetical protein